MDEEKLNIIMKLIINGGSAKSSAVEAISAAKQSNFELAEKKLKAADDFLIKGHNAQTGLLSAEAANEYQDSTSLIMVHAQDHIMTAIAFKDLAREIIDLYRIINKMKGEK